MAKTAEKARDKMTVSRRVTAGVAFTDEAKKALERLKVRLDRSASWIICRAVIAYEQAERGRAA
jgi:predicted transcriptional regulator